MASTVDKDVPQWKKDLIARLRNQNKRCEAATSVQQLYPSQATSGTLGHAVQQPILTSVEPVVNATSNGQVSGEKCNVLQPACPTVNSVKMVQERVWVDHNMVSEQFNNGCHKDSDSDSSEDLRYGPGIVSKLKNKYLSLALRESNVRPSILHMRKAASLENMLEDNDDDDDDGHIGTETNGRLFQPRFNGKDASKTTTNRYRTTNRVPEMKRARSVETISRSNDIVTEVRPKPKSHAEEIVIVNVKEGSDKPHRKMPADKPVETENKFSNRINRPKRITPIMNEREKPPADVVKQAKLIFERRAEQRTKAPPQTGDVAAKVDTYNTIIGKSKTTTAKKPPIKHKPVVVQHNDKAKPVRAPKPTVLAAQPPKILELNKVAVPILKDEPPMPSPIPDISRIDFATKGEHERGFKPANNLSETPDLILTSSPLPAPSVTSPTYKKKTTEKFLREEIHNSSSTGKPDPQAQIVVRPLKPCILNYDDDEPDNPGTPGCKSVKPESIQNIEKASSGTAVFNFVNAAAPLSKNVLTKTPLSQPLKIEINGVNVESKKPSSGSPTTRLLQQSENCDEVVVVSPKPSPPPAGAKTSKSLTLTEIEKNHINTVKTQQQHQPPTPPSPTTKSSSVCVVSNISSGGSSSSSSSGGAAGCDVNSKVVVPRKPRSPKPASTTEVFNFTNRKDVPDYISNDRSRLPGRPELPKPGEGGIILIPGASISESFTDEDDEIMRSLEAPPSPCDVTFINDNILIDGKSSLNQKSKRSKMRISFVDAGPDVFEYPSETSMLLDEIPTSPPASNAQVGHTVPNLTGSTLANYTPKSTEDFLPGVTRSIQNIPTKSSTAAVDDSEAFHEEVDQPVLFSAGTNSDMLF